MESNVTIKRKITFFSHGLGLLAFLFFNNKKKKCFGKSKGPFTLKVK